LNNPYTSRGPLHDARLFYGRVHDLNEIGTFLRGNQSVSLVGPRKIGKTSLMLHLMRAETMAALRIGGGNLFVYMDCQTLSSGQHDEIFAHFYTEIAAALRAHGLQPEPALKAAVSKPTRFAFEGALRKLNQRGLRVVLMLDEFEQLTTNPQVDVNFYNALRSAAGRLRLVFLTASARPLIELTYSERSQNILSSPFFNIFAPLFLGLLSETEARNLIRAPMEASGIVVSSRLENFIYQLAGGHPLALQIACFHAWDSPDDLYQIELRTMQELEAHFQYYWHNLSPAERDVLRHPSEAGLREAGDPALRVTFRNLIRKCLLLQMRGSYIYPSRAWAEFVSAQPHDPGIISPVKPPEHIESDDTPGQGEFTSEAPQEQLAPANRPKTMEHTIRRVMRESLPETIGALIAAVVVGTAGFIYAKSSLFIGVAKNIYDRVGPAWLVMATLAILIAGIAAIRLALKRKRGK